MARVLVIDDDQQIRSMIAKMLERDGHEVLVAADGVAGLRCFRSDRADLVVTNIFMPEKEGLETITELRDADPALPIIAISGGGKHRQAGVLELARALGATDALAKPFDMSTLVRRVRTALEEPPEVGSEE